MNAAELFVKCLEEEGVEYIFGLPGEENLCLLEAIGKSRISFILTRHESSAGFMAATYGRLTGKAGVVLATLGPGATNLVTAVAYATLGGYPLVAITGQKTLKESIQGEFQLIDVVNMMRPITKRTTQIVSSRRIPAAVRDAFKIAEEEKPGAVHLELPEDIAREKAEGSPLKRTKTRRPSPDSKAIKTAVTMIEEARSPLILIGAGANRKLIRKELQSFLDKTGIPFFTTQMGKGVIDERNEQYIGTSVLTDEGHILEAVEESDIIIAIGYDNTEKPPVSMGYGKKKILNINFYPSRINEVYFPEYEIVGDISTTLSRITEEIKVQNHWDFSYFRKLIGEWKKQINEKNEDPHFPLKPQRFVRDLRDAVPEDGIVALDNGLYKLWIAKNYPVYYQNSLLLDNALATMGAGLPSAICAKLINPQKTVVAVCGDGGFMMTAEELETAKRLGIDLTVIIVRDDAYGMVRWKQEMMGLRNFGLNFTNPDFVKFAESFGHRGFAVKKAEEFKKILKNCLESRGINIIDCPIDYSESLTERRAHSAAERGFTCG